VSERIFIIGTGLIGGSIGLALRKNGGITVRGFDASPDNASSALEIGALDTIAPDLATGAADADLIVVATPVGEIVSTVADVATHANPGTIVTDVGSTKATIVAGAETLLGPQRPFVGGHPMAGAEGEGIGSARPDLFAGALWILTPTELTESNAYRRMNAFVTTLGATALALEPFEHDRLVAFVSHLPYTVATALMALASEEGDERVFRAAAGGFRDVTRTAGTNPRVWRDIFATNREAIVVELDHFVAKLDGVRSAIANQRWDELDTFVEQARAARRRFPAKGERAPVEPVTVEVAIPDRAGVLAEITTAMGEGSISIEDIWVDHTPSGGVLHLVLDGLETGRRACDLLDGKGFRSTMVEDR
jgi:prephenate dehydrogenase